jgi:hypothetical protein
MVAVVVGSGGVVVFGGSEGEASLTKGGESHESACRWEPLAGLEKDIGSVGGLERDG